MHRIVAAVLALGLWLAPAASRAEGVNGLLAGVNGLLTFPIDPVYDFVIPPNDYDELPAPAVTGRILGLVFGTLGGVRRAGWGALDVALTPLWVVPTLSPKPKIEIIPFYEVEYEV